MSALKRAVNDLETLDSQVGILKEVLGHEEARGRRLAEEIEEWRDLFGPFPFFYKNGAGNAAGHDHNLRTIAVDLDGVIFKYQSKEEWYRDGCNAFGEVMPGAVEALAGLRSAGWHIVVYTSRNNILQGQAVGNDGRNAIELTALIQNQLEKNGIPYDYISVMKPLAAYYIDDRAIRFLDWSQAVNVLAGLETVKNMASRDGLYELAFSLEQEEICDDPQDSQ